MSEERKSAVTNKDGNLKSVKPQDGNLKYENPKSAKQKQKETDYT